MIFSPCAIVECYNWWYVPSISASNKIDSNSIFTYDSQISSSYMQKRLSLQKVENFDSFFLLWQLSNSAFHAIQEDLHLSSANVGELVWEGEIPQI